MAKKKNPLNTYWIFNGCDDAPQKRLRAAWDENWPSLQEHLESYPRDQWQVQLTVYCHQADPGPAWHEVRAVAQLPTGTVVAEAGDEDVTTLMARLAETVAAKISRNEARFRKNSMSQRRARQRADLSAVEPQLRRDKERGRRTDFIRLLRPLLGFLREHARRELRVLELEDLLHRREATLDDLLDEVVARAWERFNKRPRDLRLDMWLIDLLHDVLADWITQEPRSHRDVEEEQPEDIPPDMKFQIGDDEWWAWLLGYDETVLLEDLIPGTSGTQIWNQLEAEEQKDRLLSFMKDLPAEQRQAFALYALDDYQPAEIAQVQNRSEEQVRADIEAARQSLRERLLDAGYGRESAEIRTPVSGPA